MTALERAIYEFLRPELKGKDWIVRDLSDGRDVALILRHGQQVQPGDTIMLPPLYINGRPNMNAVFEAIPKLVAEGIDVIYMF